MLGKINPRKMTALLLSLSAMTLMSCQAGYESKPVGPQLSDELGKVPPDDNGGQGGNPPASGGTWGDVENGMDGSVEGGSYDGKVTVQVDQPNQALTFRLPISTSLMLPLFNETPITSLPGATVSHQMTQEGERAFLVKIPFQYIVKKGNLAPYNLLPNGDPLPFMPSVETQGFAISLPQNPKYRLHLYFAPNAAAVYVELPEVQEIPFLPTYMGFPVKNEQKTQMVGWLAFYARTGTKLAGVYVASRIPDKIAILIDELIRY